MDPRSKSPLLRLAAGLVAVVLGLLGYHELGGDSGPGSDRGPGNDRGTVESEAPGSPEVPGSSDGGSRESAPRILVEVPGVGGVDLTETIARIERGEKNPHRNDGAVFQNREGRLPHEASGYYHEYVHPTPGESGPGARRVVIGEGGETYYTHDHYESFQRVPRE